MIFEELSLSWLLFECSILIIIACISRARFIKTIIIKGIYSPYFVLILLPFGLIDIYLLLFSEIQIIFGVQILPPLVISYMVEHSWVSIIMYFVMFVFMIEVSQDFFKVKFDAARYAFAGILIFKIIEFTSVFLGELRITENFSSGMAIIFFLVMMIASILAIRILDIPKGFTKLESNLMIYLFIILSGAMITKVLIVIFVLKYLLRWIIPNINKKFKLDKYSFPNDKYKHIFTSILISNFMPVLWFYIFGSKIVGDINYQLIISFYYSIPILLLLILPKFNIINLSTIIFAYAISILGFYGIFFLTPELIHIGSRVGNSILGDLNWTGTILISLPLWIFLNIRFNIEFYYIRRGILGVTNISKKLNKISNLYLALIVPILVITPIFSTISKYWYEPKVQIFTIVIITIVPFVLYFLMQTNSNSNK